MLDRASLEKLAESPERNDPMLNVALAEEGTAAVLLSLAGCRAVGPEALEVVSGRIAREGPKVGEDPDVPEGERPEPFAADELDRRIVVHPNAPDLVRDEVLARHPDEPFFVLAAGAHSRATLAALARCAPL